MNLKETKYKEVTYYGVLTTHSDVTWYMLMDKPVDREEWMNDHERMFLVCQPYGTVQQIIVSGYTMRRTTGKVLVQDFQEEVEVEIQEKDWELAAIDEFINAT